MLSESVASWSNFPHIRGAGGLVDRCTAMTSFFPWKQTAVVAAAACMALASLAVSASMSLRLQDNIAAVQAATDLRRQLMSIATGMREAEAAQRMYVITGEDAHLAPLMGAMESLPGRWRAAVEAADRTPDFSPDLPPLEKEAQVTLEALKETAEVRRDQGREVGIARVVLGRSYQKLMALHMKLEAIMEQLEQRIGEQTRSLGRAEARGRFATVATGLTALGLGMLGVWQWRQSLGHYRRELTLEAEKSRAVQMAQDKSDFLAAMSHEVRTPLNAILGMSEQLRETLPAGPAMEQAEAISLAGRGMLLLVNDLLDLSRMEAGRLDLHRCEVMLAGDLEWVRSLFGPEAAGRGIHLEITSATDLPPVLWLDEGRFRQILMNLVGNALKFTGTGGRVSLRLERSENSLGSELVVEVKDTGCGIPVELQAVIFQPYVQGLSENRASSRSGTGLGLAIVRELVQLMKGAISLQSRPGLGTTFRVTLPLEVPPSGNVRERSATTPVPGARETPAAEENPPAPLDPVFAARLQSLMDELYPAALATQSTSDVGALADALHRLGMDAAAPWLQAEAGDLRRLSATFALSPLSSALETLPRRLIPLHAGLSLPEPP